MRAMNAAILVLLVPAVALFCGVFVLAMRGDAQPPSGDAGSGSRVEE